MMFRSIVFICLTTILAHQPGVFCSEAAGGENSAGANWQQWRGPLGTGVSTTANPPVKWGPGENVRWKHPIPGHGSSSPVVWEDRVFVLSAQKGAQGANESASGSAAANSPESAASSSAENTDSRGRGETGERGRRQRGPDGRSGGGRSAPQEPYQFLVHCIDRSTGKVIWQRTAAEAVPHEGHHAHHGYASPSPVTDGKRLIASFGSRGIFAYDLEGNKLWERDLGDMKTRNGFGEGSSPALHDGLVFVQWDHEGESKFYCLDADTGEIRWSADRDEMTSWATPQIATHGGVTQVIANATNRARSYDARTGAVLWSCGGQTANTIPSPVIDGDVVYCMSGFRGSIARAISLDARGELAEGDAGIRWTHVGSTPYVPSPMLYDGLLYFFAGNKNVLSVIDTRTGKLVIEPKRIDGLGDVYASPTGAAGRVYLIGRNGEAVVLQHGAEGKILAVNDLEEPIDASPALAGNQIFLRGAQNLYCIAEPPASALVLPR